MTTDVTMLLSFFTEAQQLAVDRYGRDAACFRVLLPPFKMLVMFTPDHAHVRAAFTAAAVTAFASYRKPAPSCRRSGHPTTARPVRHLWQQRYRAEPKEQQDDNDDMYEDHDAGILDDHGVARPERETDSGSRGECMPASLLATSQPHVKSWSRTASMMSPKHKSGGPSPSCTPRHLNARCLRYRATRAQDHHQRGRGAHQVCAQARPTRQSSRAIGILVRNQVPWIDQRTIQHRPRIGLWSIAPSPLGRTLVDPSPGIGAGAFMTGRER
jgi:hypothetical protein